jgi:hypothetical protein
MGSVNVDLHIHSVLSPCAGDEMLPSLILERAIDRGLAFIAVTDHNSTLNLPAFCRAARDLPIQVVPGIELQTREDIHLIGLFDRMDQVAGIQSIVDDTLPKVKNREEYFGRQLIVDAEGRVIGVEDRLLLNSLDLSLEEATGEIVKNGGVCIAAHVDRQAFGLLGVLGFIPPGLPLAALEVSCRQAAAGLINKLTNCKDYPLIYSSDAHYLKDVGRSTTRVNDDVTSLFELMEVLRGNVRAELSD